jgi:aminoglycoside phosphotransferase (APT) family kinase protein
VTVQEHKSLVHGDFHFANLRLTDEGAVAAVLDWELSTLGDPMLDLGTFFAYLDYELWNDRFSEARMTSGERAERELLLHTYCECVGWDVGDLLVPTAAAHWKIACIGEGVIVRAEAAGAHPDEKALMIRGTRRHAHAAERLLDMAGA